MRLLSQLRDRSSTGTMQDRLVWQAASLLLAYPDDGQSERLDTVDELLAHISGSAAALLGQTVSALRARDPMAAATDYVETFDMRRRATMYLTYWTAGDTRNRGRDMLMFATAYRDAGVEPPGTRRRITFPLSWNSPRLSMPRSAGGCSLSIGSRSTCYGAPWRTPSRPTSTPWQRSARRYRLPPTRRRAALSGWRRLDRPQKPLGCNRLP